MPSATGASPALPPPSCVVVLQSGEKLGTAIHEFLKAKNFSVQLVDRADGVLTSLDPTNPPLLLVVDLFQPRSVWTALRKKLNEPAFRKVETLLVTKKAESKEYHHRAAEIPRSRLVAGSGRLVVRVLEMVAGIVGLSLPRCERVDVQLEGELRAGNGARRVPVQAHNVSDTGVKLSASAGLEVGSQWELTLELRDDTFVAPVQVVRTFLDHATDQWQIGLRFTKLSQEMRTLLDRLIEGAPEMTPPAKDDFTYQGEVLRSAVRLSMPSRLGVKCRVGPQDSKARIYLQVVDVSERGFRARWLSRKSTPFEIQVGMQLDTTLIWAGHSLIAQSEVVWRGYREGSEGALEFGFRFWNLPRNSRRELSRLLFGAMDRGLKGSDALTRGRKLGKGEKSKPAKAKGKPKAPRAGSPPTR